MMCVTLVFVIYLMNPQAWADEVKPPSKSTTKELMGKFLSHMEALKSYLVSEEKFADPQNFSTIDSHLKELATLSKKAAHDPRLQLPGYRVSRQVLEEHIAETERVYRVGNKSYARWMLGSTLSICMSCHTQIPTVSRKLQDFEDVKPFSKPFEQAEFLFATRAFDNAKEIFEKTILSYPADDITSDQVETALERMITYYARIQRDPNRAVLVLEKYQGNKKLPTFLKEDIKAWLQAFKDWKKDPTLDPASATDAQIVEFAKKNLDPKVSGYVMSADNPRAALYLKVSGILYQYLQQHPTSPATPDLLYWLAICDRGLNNNFFYSLADVYLKECIVNFPQSVTAKQCYDEYEAETTLSYSGSGGTNIPDDVRLDLGRLKALIIAPPPSQGAKH